MKEINSLIFYSERNIGASASYVEDKLLEVRKLSSSPVSNFSVAAIFKVDGAGRQIYIKAANFEAPFEEDQRADLRAGLCAEETTLAIAAVTLGPNFKIKKGWVVGAPKDTNAKIPCTPCGKCRQIIEEFSTEHTVIYNVFADKSKTKEFYQKELLPYAFKFDAEKEIDISLEKKLTDKDINDRLTRNGNLNKNDIFNWAKSLKGLHSATQQNDRIILQLSNENWVAGVNFENASFPVSTGAGQAAVAISRMLFPNTEILSAYQFCVNEKTGKIIQNINHTDLAAIHSHAAKDLTINHFDLEGKIKLRNLSGRAY